MLLLFSLFICTLPILMYQVFGEWEATIMPTIGASCLLYIVFVGF